MRILFWAEHFWPLIGGVEVRLLYLLDALREQGHDCCVITNRFDAAPLAFEERQGIPIHRLGIRDALLAKNIGRLKAVQAAALAIKREFSPDLEHVVCTGPSIIVPKICHQQMPRPLVVTLHHDFGNLFRDHTNDAFASLFKRASNIIVLSHLMERDLKTKFPALAARVELVESGLPWPAIKDEPLPFDPPRILCLGRLVRDKGFDIALRAFARLAKEHPELRMEIAGDGDERIALEKLSCDLGLEGQVAFLGWVESPQIARLINESTFLVVPSRNQEPSAVVVREAAQMGRPVIATRVGGTPDLIEHGVNGLLVEPDDDQALAVAMRQLLSDSSAARKMGATARRLAFDRFDFSRYLTHILTIYERARIQFSTPPQMLVENAT